MLSLLYSLTNWIVTPAQGKSGQGTSQHLQAPTDWSLSALRTVQGYLLIIEKNHKWTYGLTISMLPSRCVPRRPPRAPPEKAVDNPHRKTRRSTRPRLDQWSTNGERSKPTRTNGQHNGPAKQRCTAMRPRDRVPHLRYRNFAPSSCVFVWHLLR